LPRVHVRVQPVSYVRFPSAAGETMLGMSNLALMPAAGA